MTYATEAERIAARRRAYVKYNRAHRAEKAAHNKEYVQKEDVKARRRQLRLLRKTSSSNDMRVDPTN